MKKLFLISSFFGFLTVAVHAQINKMYRVTNTKTQVNQPNNTKTQINQAADTRTLSPNIVIQRNATSYHGMINISPDIDSKMQTEWQGTPAQFAGHQLKAELWTVSYQQDPKNANNTQIILQQRVSNINLSYQATAGGIAYSMGNAIAAPAASNLAVIVYSDPLKSDPGLIIKGKPDDGSAQTRQSFLHRYASDAKYKLGQNIVYGVYSIVPGKTDLNHLDFSFSMPGNIQAQSLIGDVVDDITGVASKVIDGVTYYFDQVYNGVTDLAKFIINGEADIVGFYINEAGEILFVEGNTLVNLICYGNLPRARPMHQDEYDWANKQIFNGTLPPIGMFKVFNFMKPGHLFYTWPSPGGAFIYLNIGDAYDDPENYSNSSYPGAGQEFIHELAHAWQIYKYGYVGMVTRYFADGGTGQDYNPNDASQDISGNFSIEQQATMVDRTFLRVYYDKGDSWSSPMQQQWVELNVRNGVKIDVNKIKATLAMQQHANDPAVKSFVGTVQGDAVFSKGNSADGSGYYMQGSNPGSFLYYDTAGKKAWANWGPIRQKYEAMGVEFGMLSWPVDDEKRAPTKAGWYQYFHGGVIYYSLTYGVYYISGPILAKWKEQGYENGRLGFPKSDPITSTSGNNARFKMNGMATTTQLFEGGELFMRPTTRTSKVVNSDMSASVHVIFSNILGAWNPDLGFPASDQVSVPAKSASTFVHGQSTPAFDSVVCDNATIYWSNAPGAHVVAGEILSAYKSLGGSTSALGLPTGDQVTSAPNGSLNKMVRLTGDYSQQFQGGTINYTGGKIDVQYKGNRILDTKSQIIIKRVH